MVYVISNYIHLMECLIDKHSYDVHLHQNCSPKESNYWRRIRRKWTKLS